MKRFLMLLSVALMSVSLFTVNAEAKSRFGGGGSVGKQRTMSAPAQKAPAAAPAPTNTASPAPAPQPAGNKWLGPLAGLAIGAGLGALFAGSGMGGAFGGILMVLALVAVVMFALSMFRKQQRQPAMQYAGHGNSYEAPASQPVATGSGVPVSNTVQANVPADFPVEAFLRSAKTSFIRLQAANDRKDLNDVREYTTPEMFAEVSMQFQERGNASQVTEVISISTDLLEVANEGDIAIASVRMSGQIRENNGAPEQFDEIWHVQKNVKDPKAVWLLAGIQQIN